ncbi:hypothetical protein PNP85_04170 [Halobacterium salinarum]|uniref:hypothetical protein n=1 Tax=Halobacterium salinarum TaxID=2242 RepID=UPI002553AE9F|nr:hypothetical protein [Halobacterium salinarum]MDL0135622.1 hypothetical protein [Halobacterium salinarum]MDL0138703.1 hypothetical protein [Halobacterium salinarum]
MAESVTVSRWKMVFTAIMGVLGAVSQGYQIAQGEQGLLTIVLLIAFLLITAFAGWPILAGNTE